MNDLELVQTLRDVTNTSTAHHACSRIAEALEFRHYLYAVRIPVSLTKPHHFVLNGYPVAWRELYEQRGYLAVDPVIAHAFRQLTPVCWDEIERSDPKVQAFFSEADKFGLSHGISVPICGHGGELGLLSLAREEPITRDREARLAITQRLQWFASHVHENLRRVALDQQPEEQHGALLNERERDCLRWVADGKTSWEIGQIMQIAEATVVYHVQRAASKLGVKGRQLAVTRAIALGEIEATGYDPAPQRDISDAENRRARSAAG